MVFPRNPQPRTSALLFLRNPSLADAGLLKKHGGPFLSMYSIDGLAYALMSMSQGVAMSLMSATFSAATWMDSETVCCLASGERHLGHIVKAGDNWLAYDGTHLSERGAGFRLLGCCTSIALAKYAVEQVLRKEMHDQRCTRRHLQ